MKPVMVVNSVLVEKIDSISAVEEITAARRKTASAAPCKSQVGPCLRVSAVSAAISSAGQPAPHWCGSKTLGPWVRKLARFIKTCMFVGVLHWFVLGPGRPLEGPMGSPLCLRSPQGLGQKTQKPINNVSNRVKTI